MFTGIVQGIAQVTHIEKKPGLQSHTISLPQGHTEHLQIGASVAHNGCCLTVTAISGDNVTFDLMQETLKLTNLGLLEEGSYINFERAAKFGDEIGGHVMSGHIIATVDITEIIASENNKTIWFKAPEELMKYILPKGFVGLDGCSLTIGDVKDDHFSVHLIPETIERTLFGKRQIGHQVNLEIDASTQAVVDTVERVMHNNKNAVA
ncbi:riboflavin synthase subunit alpha [Vibrio viridaestus]|uniref:Riboflavin synthase n=1 Tax=Vibrio viridaestus TaxID=2487322 RepID=A0A3N9U696_9VIBR|nr:riboflavin synthase subunit alpha [Vibrio viridaestus]RQW63596.1 riboflavin synthase subunit alpha [Vibrio viridaestus]